MAEKLKLRKGDKIVVIAGKHRGARGEILQIVKGEKPGDHRVVVGGVNKVKRHTRPSPRSPGGIIEKEAPIHISNVALADPKDSKPSRIGHTFLEDGRKVRFARSSGEIIDR